MSYIVARVLDRRKEELKELERDTAPLERVQAPFPRISYTDAVARAQPARLRHASGAHDLGGDDETLLAQQYDRPVFVYNYPKGVKAFYMKENPDDPRTVLNNDCLAPEGYGEIIGGLTARGRLRQAAGADQRAGARSRGVPLVPRPPEVRHLRALGLRARRRADGGVDLRDSAHPGGDRVSAADSPAVSVERAAVRRYEAADGERQRRSQSTDPPYAVAVLRSRVLPSSHAAFTSSHSPSSTSSPAACSSIPRSSASRSTASNRSPELRGWHGRAPGPAGRRPSARG